MNRASTAWMFLAPAGLVLGVFFLLPVVTGLLLSFTDYDLYALADIHNLRFVGLHNYWELLHRPLFWAALGHTFYFVAVGVPLSMLASLGAALLLNSPLSKARAFFRTALFAPVVTTVVAVAVIWRYLFNPKYGMVNFVLAHAGIHPVDWLGDPHWAMPMIILFAVWKNFGYNMIILLAGLQAIPAELYEAARIDGASAVRQFRHITLPSLGPILLMVGILTVAGYFQLFAEPYVITEGGPLQSTLSVLYLMYDEGFKYWNMGTASAVAFLLFIIMFAVTALMWRAGEARESLA
jgi:multiple sugar transport system permease protein